MGRTNVLSEATSTVDSPTTPERRSPVVRAVPNPPSLRRRTEQTLAAHPGGLAWQALAEEVARRAVAAGAPAPRPADVVRELGGLIAEGRVDDRQGRFVLLPFTQRPAMPFIHDQAA